MLLPSHFTIEISSQKLTGYLLNMEHPDGRSKAAFLLKNGFGEPESLRLALLQLITNHPVTQQRHTIYGTKYVVDGLLISPQGKEVSVRTVWIVLQELSICTFVTAYPI